MRQSILVSTFYSIYFPYTGLEIMSLTRYTGKAAVERRCWYWDLADFM